MSGVGRLLRLWAAGALLAGPLAAQQRPARVVSLRLGRAVMVQVDGARYAGRLASLAGDTLVLTPAEATALPLVAPLARIEGVWVRGSAWKTGALVGGSVVGAAGVVVFSVGCIIVRSDNGVIGDEGRWADCALLGGAFGFAAGGLVGGAIGAMVPKWHVRYRARDGAALQVRLDF